MKQRLLPVLFAFTFAILQSCTKDRDTAPQKEKITSGIYVLYEGGIGKNNSGISYYNIETGQVEKDYFRKVNGYGLGETATDLKQYGSKMYCVVSGIQGEEKSFVEVIDPATGKSIKRISFNTETGGSLPRYIAFHKNKAYVSSYSGVVSRIDTASLEIDGNLTTGGAMEGIAVSGDKMYVANSAHYLYPEAPRHTVSVIDIATFKKLKDIEVGNNPQHLTAASNGNLFLIGWGDWNDYETYPATFQMINTRDDVVTSTLEVTATRFALYNGTGLTITDPYGTPTIKSFNPVTGALSSGGIIASDLGISTPNGLNINDYNGDLCIADATNYSSNGKVVCISSNGSRKFEFETGIAPQHAVFVYAYK